MPLHVFTELQERIGGDRGRRPPTRQTLRREIPKALATVRARLQPRPIRAGKKLTMRQETKRRKQAAVASLITEEISDVPRRTFARVEPVAASSVQIATAVRPGDRRNFVHKRLLGAIGGFAQGGPIGAARGFVAARPAVPRSQTARPSAAGAAGQELGRDLKFGGRSLSITRAAPGDDCRIPGMRRDPGTGQCRWFLGDRAGPDGGAPVGDPVMGQYGAALAPGIMTIDRAICPRGMRLATDSLCYNKTQISNKQRMWPTGRKPLLTGGEMRAISTASRAGKRLEGATKRLQGLGFMKKPIPRKAKAAVHVVTAPVAHN